MVVNGDMKVEPDEEFTVVLSNALLGGVASPKLMIRPSAGSATRVIKNDDVFEIMFTKGWNLFSVPITDADEVDLSVENFFSKTRFFYQERLEVGRKSFSDRGCIGTQSCCMDQC